MFIYNLNCDSFEFNYTFFFQFHDVDPCFNSGENLTGLARGDAEFVVAIHSNSGALGKRDPLGKKITMPIKI